MICSLLAGTMKPRERSFCIRGRGSYKRLSRHGLFGAMARDADRYFQAEVSTPLKLVPEGIEGQVPYKGSAVRILHQLAGGLRAAMGYTGNRTVAQMQTDVNS